MKHFFCPSNIDEIWWRKSRLHCWLLHSREVPNHDGMEVVWVFRRYFNMTLNNANCSYIIHSVFVEHKLLKFYVQHKTLHCSVHVIHARYNVCRKPPTSIKSRTFSLQNSLITLLEIFYQTNPLLYVTQTTYFNPWWNFSVNIYVHNIVCFVTMLNSSFVYWCWNKSEGMSWIL